MLCGTTTYTIKTDADMMTVAACNFNDAAHQYDDQFESAADLLAEAARSDGGWAWIENEATGERIGAHTADGLRRWLVANGHGPETNGE